LSIKQDKDAGWPRLVLLLTYYGANFRPLARISQFPKLAEPNSVAYEKLVHRTTIHMKGGLRPRSVSELPVTLNVIVFRDLEGLISWCPDKRWWAGKSRRLGNCGASLADVFVGGVLCTLSALDHGIKPPSWFGLEPGRKFQLPLGLLFL
jgi:hypothetical protein